MSILKIVLIPILIITIVCGSYFAIVDGIKDSITMKIGKLQEILDDTLNMIVEGFRKTSNWIEDKLNIGNYALPNGAQTLFFEINNQKFQQVKDAIDDIINVEEGGYDDIIIKKMLLTYYSSICTRDTQILISITEEEFNNFNDDEGVFEKVTGDQFGGSKENLYLSSYGIIELYTDGEIDKDNKMVYLPKEDLDKVKEDATTNGMDNAVEALAGCYTISDIGKIKMYKITKTVQEKNTSYKDGTEKESSDTEKNEAQMVELDYSKYSSPYVIPVEFLADLLNLTGSPDFIDKFSKLQYDSYIRLGIYQTSIKEVTTNTKEYDLKTTIKGVTNINFDGSEYLKDLQEIYPEDSKWIEDEEKWGGSQCWAFVQWATEAYYGTRADSSTKDNNAGKGWTKKRDKKALDTIKPGDTIRYHRSDTNDVGHSAWVIGVDGDELTLAEANWSGGNIVTWTRTVTKDEVKGDHFDYVIVAPYAIGENEETVNNKTDESSQITGEEIEYSETEHTVEKDITQKEDYNYQMEIVDIDTWYVKITQENNKVTSETTYQTWNENQELVEIDSTDKALKISQSNEQKQIDPIEDLKEGFEKDVIDRVIKNSKEKNCTWQTADLEKSSVTKCKLIEATSNALNKGEKQVLDNTDKFLALLKNTSGIYSRQDAIDGNYNPSGKVIAYTDIYNGKKAYVGDLLENGAEVLFQLLEDNLIGDEEGTSNTQALVDVMKYILWRYSGTDYGVTNFNMIDFINSDLSMVGADITVQITDNNTDLVLSKEELLNTIDAMNYPEQAKENMKGAIDALMKIQEEYKVNAVFAIAVTMAESTGGTNWDAIDPTTYNWMSVKDGKGGWSKYSSFSDATEKFGNLIANGAYYFKAGKTTVGQIAPTYCNEKWGETVLGYMNDFYKTAGVSLTLFSGGDFLSIAKKCHDYLRENEYFYSYGYNKAQKAYVTDGPANSSGGIVADYIPKPNDVDGCNIVDCSSYVTWVLYEYGYTELKGWQKTSTWFYNQQYPSSYGWKKIASSQAQPGDILVNSGHVEIYAGNNQSYSCGSTQAIRATISNCNPSSFSFAIRIPNK